MNPTASSARTLAALPGPEQQRSDAHSPGVFCAAASTSQHRKSCPLHDR